MPNGSLSVDIWLNYGSFVYGFEGTIVSLSHKSLEVDFSEHATSRVEELINFFEDLVSTPRGLVQTEIRIYTDTLVSSVKLPIVINLVTDLSPYFRVQSSLQLLFDGIIGTSEADAKALLQLVALFVRKDLV